MNSYNFKMILCKTISPAKVNSNYIYYAFAHLTFSTNPSFVNGFVEPSNLQHATSQKSRFSFLFIIGLW